MLAAHESVDNCVWIYFLLFACYMTTVIIPERLLFAVTILISTSSMSSVIIFPGELWMMMINKDTINELIPPHSQPSIYKEHHDNKLYYCSYCIRCVRVMRFDLMLNLTLSQILTQSATLSQVLTPRVCLSQIRALSAILSEILPASALLSEIWQGSVILLSLYWQYQHKIYSLYFHSKWNCLNIFYLSIYFLSFFFLFNFLTTK